MTLILDPSRIPPRADGGAGAPWPLARREVEAVRDELTTGIATLARKATEGPERDAFVVVALHHLNEALALYQATAVARRCRGRGVEVEPPPRSRVLAALLQDRAPEAPAWLGAFAAAPPPPPGPWPHAVRRLAGELKASGWRAGAPRSAHHPVALHVMPVLRAHARSARTGVSVRFAHEFFRSPRAAPPSAPELGDAAVDAVEDAFRVGGEALPASLGEAVRERLDAGLVAARRHLATVQARPLPAELWTGTGGDLWTRVVQASCRGTGGRVTGHDHGLGSGHLDHAAKGLSDLAFCDTFVTFTAAQAEGLRRSVRPDRTFQDKAPDIVALPSRTWHGRGRARGRPRDLVRRVMYPSSFYNGDRVHYAIQVPDVVQVDWEARLFARLADWGFDVLHKPHPGSITLPPAWLGRLPRVRTLAEPFEQVMHLADVLVVLSPQSTAMVSALRAGLPLVFVDLGLFHWWPEARRLFERRCAVIGGEFDEDGRIQVDWDALRAAIAEAPRRMDPAFEEAYLGAPLPGEPAA